MIPTKHKIMQFPVKIGDEIRVPSYAATLVNGEEQLLITREGNIYITNGAGGYSDVKTGFENDFSSFKTDILDSILNLQEQITANEDPKSSLHNVGIKSSLPSFSAYPSIDRV